MSQKPEVNEDEEFDHDLEIGQEAPKQPPKAAQPKQPQGAAPETYGTAVGVITPPPEIKVYVDRTADFVRKVGTAFESEILQRNAGAKAKKFQFLIPGTPYHAYYQLRMKYGEDIPADANVPAPPAKDNIVIEAEPQISTKPKKPSLLERLSQELKSVKVTTEDEQPPQPDRFAVRAIDAFQPVDLDVVKLTAQFVARNGRNFLSGLTSREAKNEHFAFLKPTHILFTYFQQMVDAYTQIIVPPAHMMTQLREMNDQPQKVLDHCLARAKFEKDKRADVDKKQHDEAQEREAMAQIDWTRFVVVETIQFLPEDEAYLPVAKNSIEEINIMLSAASIEETARAEAAQMPQESAAVEADMEVDMEMDMEAQEQKEQKERDKQVALAVPTDADLDIRKEDEEEEEEARARAKVTQYQQCPVCKQLILVAELAEHMRIELLDPKWKEQKERLAARQAETALATPSSIAQNLSRLARNRTDLFSSDETRERREKQEKQREETEKMAWQAHLAQQKAEIEKEKAVKAGAAAAPAKVAVPMPRPGMPGMPGIPGMPMMPGAPGMPLNVLSRAPAPAGTVPTLLPTPAPPPGVPAGAAPLPGSRGYVAPFPPAAPAPPVPRPPGQPAPPMPGVPRPPAMPAPPAAALFPGGIPQHLAPDSEDLPASKKQKLSGAAVAEDEWAARFPDAITVHVVTPVESDKKEWLFDGRTVQLSLSVRDSLQTLKDKLSVVLGGMPDKKMKINIAGGAYLNTDKFSLAYYNIGEGAVLQVAERTRGGRGKG